MEKLCIACRKILPVEKFTFITTRKVHLARCRPCDNEWQKGHRLRRAGEYREYQRRKRREQPVKFMLYSTRQGARMAGLEHTIKECDISMPDVCPILGIKLTTGYRCATDRSPSLDRIDPNKGYVPGNVQVISYKANTMKSNATPEELKAFAQWILKTLK